MKQSKLQKMVLTALLAACSWALSTVLVFPNMAPMQHFINVIAAVLLGPWWALACAAMTGFMRMLLGGRTLLSVIGAVFGALLAGLLYRWSKKVIWAVIGEIIGTGIISAIVAVPVMKAVYGLPDASTFMYVPFFIPSAAAGASLGFLFLGALDRTRVLAWMGFGRLFGVGRNKELSQ